MPTRLINPIKIPVNIGANMKVESINASKIARVTPFRSDETRSDANAVDCVNTPPRKIPRTPLTNNIPKDVSTVINKNSTIAEPIVSIHKIDR